MNDRVNADSIVHRLQEALDRKQKRLCLVLIGGCSRSGKSALVERLSSRLNGVGIRNGVVRLDSWLIGVDQRKAQSTVLERYEGQAIVESIHGLLRGKTIFPPIYNAKTRRRRAERGKTGIRIASGVLIVEGVIALALEPLVRMADLRIFVSVSDPERLERLRDFYTRNKGFTSKETEEIIQSREKEEVPFIKETAKKADIVVVDPAVGAERTIPSGSEGKNEFLCGLF